MNNQPNQSNSPVSGDDNYNQNTASTAGFAGSEALATAGASRKSGSARSTAQPAASAQPESPQNAQDNETSGNAFNKALEGGKKWIEDSGVLNNVNRLPQSVKDWSSRAATRVNDLTTTQKLVGGALLAAGIGYLATRKGKSDNTESRNDRQGSSYGRRSSRGYQAPDASNSRRVSAGSGRTDSGSPYGNSGSKYGSSNTDSGFGLTASDGDFSTRRSESHSSSKTDNARPTE